MKHKSTLRRVYLNSLDKGRLWSVDQGEGSRETKWDLVHICTPAETRQDLSKRGSKTEPCCWIATVGTLVAVKVGNEKHAVIE